MSKNPELSTKKTTPNKKKSTASATEDRLLHQAFDTSLQANIVSTVSSGRIIMANSAACKLLGYSKKELLTKSRATVFDINETSFKKMLKQRTAEGHSKALVTAIDKSGKLLPCEITSAVFVDPKGSAKSITTIVDMSAAISNQLLIDTKNEKKVAEDIIRAQTKSDVRLAENNRWIKYIAKTSYDVMWDWDIITGEIYVGDSIQELFGYRIQNNKVDFSDFERCLLPAEKDGVEEKLFETLASSQKNWKDTFLFKRSNGSMASTTSRASIVRDEAGKAIRLIGATHDLTRQMELQGKLKNEVSKRGKLLTEYQENFKLIFNSSSDVLYDVDLITNRVLLSNSYEHIFGYKLVNNLLPVDEWFSHIHPDDKEGLVQDYHQMLSSGTKEWKYSFRFLKADTSVANVLTRCIVLRDATGKAYRRIGYMQDMSRQRVLEQSLEQEITLKEKQIVSAAEKAKEAERLLLGEELHDNVNQLLCTSKLYLDMAKLGGDNIESFLSRSSEYTTLAMEEIRKLTQELTSSAGMDFKLREAIIKVSRDIMEAYPIKINASLETFMEDSVNEKMKLYIFRIVQEQLNNIIKHAKASKVDIKLLPCLTHINLSISDDGVGFDPEMNGKGIGVKNIKRRVEHYQGTAAFISQPGKGCVLLVTFPVTKPISYPNNVLATDRSNVLVEKITNVIVEIIHHPERQLKTNFSEYLSKKTGYDYTYLANVFSQVKGTTIEKFIISHRIEKVKEMILTDDANLTKIALRLHYSSVAHLSHQFKKVTGFTPSKFKQLSQGTAHL